MGTPSRRHHRPEGQPRHPRTARPRGDRDSWTTSDDDAGSFDRYCETGRLWTK
jgi:hypothetical protein